MPGRKETLPRSAAAKRDAISRRSQSAGEQLESRSLIQAAFQLARDLGVSKLLVQADELHDIRAVKRLLGTELVIWLTREPDKLGPLQEADDVVLRIPYTRLSRVSQINIGLFLAVLNGHVEPDETILCLSGVAGSERIDTLLIANARRDFPWFRSADIDETRVRFATQVFVRTLVVSARFAAEGREGKPIGTIFVVGDTEELEPHLRQLILNPLAGHPKRNRNIHSPEFLETLRELAGLDGAFIVTPKGTVESAATYLNAPGKRIKVPSGLGARHAAAAAITANTKAFSVVLSQSSQTITVFHGGRAILELEKPRPTAGVPKSSRTSAATDRSSS
jgi:hypothetical protein